MQYRHTDLLPTHTVYKTDSIVLAPSHAEDVLFIASTLHLVNHMSFPASLEAFTLLLTGPDGSELSTRAVQTSDLPNLQLSFPALKPLLSQPLLRESVLAPGQALDGVVLFSLPLTQLTWDARKAATVTVDVFHQPSLSQLVPKP